MNNLLITIGCSLIEGDGAYNQSNLDRYKRGEGGFEIIQTGITHERGFLRYGIGHNLQRMWGYSDLLNIGIGSSSPSYQFDELFKMVDFNKIKQEYNSVSIFMLLTYPSRYNKYVKGKTQTYHIHEFENIIEDKNQSIESIYTDSVMDQMQYINIINQIALMNGWNIIWGCVDKLQNEVIIKNKLTKYLSNLLPNSINGSDCLIDMEYLKNNDMVSYDYHPNRSGYDWISNNIADWVSENKPHIKLDYNLDVYNIKGMKRNHNYEIHNGDRYLFDSFCVNSERDIIPHHSD
jgi:hypothetical protein